MIDISKLKTFVAVADLGADEEEIRKFILHIWSQREDRYSEKRLEMLKEGIKPKKVEMFKIGG